MSSPRTLLPYQRRWVRDDAPLKIIEKSRRIGISWAEAYAAVMRTAEDKGDVYYMSYAREMTEGFAADCGEWAEVLHHAVEEAGEVLLDPGTPDPILTYQIRMASGRRIVCMTAAPRGFRSKGRPGDLAVIDEAAFVDDLAAILKAALAFLMWGGLVHVMSTHNGEASPFATLVRDVREERRPGSVHRVTFDEAVAAGLYERICLATGERWSAEAEAAWVAETRRSYGPDAGEELDAVPSAGAGAWLSWDLLRRAEEADTGAWETDGQVRRWRRTDVPPGMPATVGVDIARRRHLWVAVAVGLDGRARPVLEIVEALGVPFAKHDELLGGVVERCSPFRIAADQGGMGEKVVEDWQGVWGQHRVEGVLLTAPRRLDVATSLREALEDARVRMPADDDLRADLHAVRKEAGSGGMPRLVNPASAAGAGGGPRGPLLGVRPGDGRGRRRTPRVRAAPGAGGRPPGRWIADRLSSLGRRGGAPSVRRTGVW